MPDVREEEEEDDDLVDDLPPIGPLEDDEEGLDGLDLAASIEADGPETIGLDDSAGLEDPDLFELELPTDEAVDEEDFDPIPIVETIDEGDEYGWTDEVSSHAEESWDAGELGLPELRPLGRDDDGGAEGTEEVFELGDRDDDAVPDLPPLEDLDADEDEGIDLELGVPEPEEEATLPPLLDGVAVEILVQGPVLDVAVTERGVWAAGRGGLYRDGRRLAAEGLAGTPLSICAGPGWVLTGTAEGTFRSVDEGARFTPVEALSGGAHHFVLEASGTVWSRGPTGRVQRSDDGGITWSPPLLLTKVAALATPGRGVITLSAPESARPQLASSEDGGARWAAADAPPFERALGAACDVAACGDRIALASAADPGGPFLSRDRGRTWLRVPGLPTAEAVALRDEGTLEIFAAHPQPTGTTIARHVPDQDVASGALVEGAGAVHRLVVAPDGLLAATERGLLRIRVAVPE